MGGCALMDASAKLGWVIPDMPTLRAFVIDVEHAVSGVTSSDSPHLPSPAVPGRVDWRLHSLSADTRPASRAEARDDSPDSTHIMRALARPQSRNDVDGELSDRPPSRGYDFRQPDPPAIAAPIVHANGRFQARGLNSEAPATSHASPYSVHVLSCLEAGERMLVGWLQGNARGELVLSDCTGAAMVLAPDIEPEQLGHLWGFRVFDVVVEHIRPSAVQLMDPASGLRVCNILYIRTCMADAVLLAKVPDPTPMEAQEPYAEGRSGLAVSARHGEWLPSLPALRPGSAWQDGASTRPPSRTGPAAPLGDHRTVRLHVQSRTVLSLKHEATRPGRNAVLQVDIPDHGLSACSLQLDMSSFGWYPVLRRGAEYLVDGAMIRFDTPILVTLLPTATMRKATSACSEDNARRVGGVAVRNAGDSDFGLPSPLRLRVPPGIARVYDILFVSSAERENSIVSFVGRITSKDVRAEDRPGTTFMRALGRTANFGLADTTLVLRVRDVEAPDHIDVYLKMNEIVFPLGLLPGTHAIFHNLQRRTSQAGNVYCTVTALSSVEPIQPMPSTPTDWPGGNAPTGSLHSVPVRSLVSFATQASLDRRYCRVRGRIVHIHVAKFWWQCGTCGTELVAGRCRCTTAESQHGWRVEASAGIQDGTAEVWVHKRSRKRRVSAGKRREGER